MKSRVAVMLLIASIPTPAASQNYPFEYAVLRDRLADFAGLNSGSTYAVVSRDAVGRVGNAPCSLGWQVAYSIQRQLDVMFGRVRNPVAYFQDLPSNVRLATWPEETIDAIWSTMYRTVVFVEPILIPDAPVILIRVIRFDTGAEARSQVALEGPLSQHTFLSIAPYCGDRRAATARPSSPTACRYLSQLAELVASNLLLSPQGPSPTEVITQFLAYPLDQPDATPDRSLAAIRDVQDQCFGQRIRQRGRPVSAPLLPSTVSDAWAIRLEVSRQGDRQSESSGFIELTATVRSRTVNITPVSLHLSRSDWESFAESASPTTTAARGSEGSNDQPPIRTPLAPEQPAQPSDSPPVFSIQGVGMLMERAGASGNDGYLGIQGDIAFSRSQPRPSFGVSVLYSPSSGAGLVTLDGGFVFSRIFRASLGMALFAGMDSPLSAFAQIAISPILYERSSAHDGVFASVALAGYAALGSADDRFTASLTMGLGLRF